MAVHTFIESLGVYLPARRVSTREVVDGCVHRPRVDVENQTGIRSRAAAGEGEYCTEIATQAIAKCFEISRRKPSEIDLLISCSISRCSGPEFKFTAEPCAAAGLAAAFGIHRNAMTFDISNACAGMFTGVLLADSLLRAGAVKKAIVVSGEYLTHITWNAQKELDEGISPQFASLTVGDAGAAVLMEGTENGSLGFSDVDLFSSAKYCDLCIGTTSDKEHGGYVMYTESQTLLPNLIMISSEHIANRIKKLGVDVSEYNHFIPHQIASKYVKGVGQMLNMHLGQNQIAPEKVIDNTEFRGNTASNSHFVALWDHILNGTIKSFDKILFGVQASGIVSGFASYTLDDLPSRIHRHENRAV
jgi:3-oxoacyl-[acyl-carrier-protein] synthase III